MFNHAILMMFILALCICAGLGPGLYALSIAYYRTLKWEKEGSPSGFFSQGKNQVYRFPPIFKLKILFPLKPPLLKRTVSLWDDNHSKLSKKITGLFGKQVRDNVHFTRFFIPARILLILNNKKRKPRIRHGLVFRNLSIQLI
jgi:hypothetical protein